MDTDDVVALFVGAALALMLVLIAYRAHRYGSPGTGLLVAFTVALVLSFLLLAEEAI
jgi:hypothetical protein